MYNYGQKEEHMTEKTYKKRHTMRDNLKEDYREVQTSPSWVAMGNKTPDALGERDDFAWAIAEELTAFFYDQGMNGKQSGYYFRVGQSSLDKSMVRRKYKEDPARFRNGDGKQLTLAEFGRNMVRYFKKNSNWQYCNSVEEVVGMFYDPVTLDDCAKGLWRVYRDRRTRKGIK
jgi:hypothetical protein